MKSSYRQSVQKSQQSQVLATLDLALYEEMKNLERREAHEPMVPPKVCIKETDQLLAALRANRLLWGPVMDLGFDQAWMEKTVRCMELAAVAQEAWHKVCENEEYGSWEALEVRGIRMRAHMLAMAKYHMRHQKHLVQEIEAIQAGDGVPDLILDLDALARLFRAKRMLLKKEKSVELPAFIDAARALSRALREVMHEVPAEILEARERRNRAFCILERRIEDLRAAGRYRFWDDEELLGYFVSTYMMQAQAR